MHQPKKYTTHDQPFGKLHLPWKLHVTKDGDRVRTASILNADEDGGAYGLVYEMPKGMTQQGKQLWLRWAEFTIEAVNSYFH